MKKTILAILILILLTGCSGLYGLNSFVLPDDGEFLALVEELDEPRKIGRYMLDNFTYVPHGLYTPGPYILWQIQEGDCNDFATFGVFIANYHGYETYQIIIYYKDTVYKHALAIYKENNLYNFSDNQYYILIGAIDFKEIVEYDKYLTGKDWSKYIVYDFDMNIVKTEYNN